MSNTINFTTDCLLLLLLLLPASHHLTINQFPSKKFTNANLHYEYMISMPLIMIKSCDDDGIVGE